MVKEAGGINVADEVQTGFGRTGSHYWGFQTQVRASAQPICWPARPVQRHQHVRLLLRRRRRRL